MPGYFQNMPMVGSAVTADAENMQSIKEIEARIQELAEKARSAGRSDESLNASGQLTAMQRIRELVDDGVYWCPLNSLFNPGDNENGSTSIVKGLGRIEGKWAVIVASDNKKAAGAWVPGMPENLERAAATARIMRIPLIYLLNCAGVRLDKQELLFPGRRGGGVPFYENAMLAQAGVPVLVGVYGTNPAGGGYHAISPTIIIAHKDANMAVGGAGILSGMRPKGNVDEESAMALINAQSGNKPPAPGGTGTHHDKTGFMREVYDTDQEVVYALRKYMSRIPAYDLEFFRVAPAYQPAFPEEELYSVIPLNQRRIYDIYQVLGRILDNSEFSEYKKGYGPEIVCGLARVDGLLTGVIANQQGVFSNYPKYRPAGTYSVGGKLYREGLIKMSEFVTMCNRDRIPMIWLQDSSGIDVDDIAEQAELLGLGQSLIYSIQNGIVPHLEITLRKGSAAAHYVLGGPQCEKLSPFTLGLPTCEYYVMHGETAAAALYVRQLVKKHKKGEPIDGIIKDMNDLINDYHVKSRPEYTAKLGSVDEIVPMTQLRNYMIAFIQAAYQNPASICPFHQMLTPRSIAEYNNNWYGK